MSIAGLLPATSPALDGDDSAVRTIRGTILSLLYAGRADEAEARWRELPCDAATTSWAQNEIERAMARDDFALLEGITRLHALHRWRGAVSTTPRSDGALLPRAPRDMLTAYKLRHDAGQLAHLRDLGLIEEAFDRVIATYERLAARLEARGGPEARIGLDGDDRAVIGNVYNRIVFLPRVERVGRALSRSWDPRSVEERFLERGEAVVVIDDFLTPEALEGLHRFAMQATVWSGIRYAFGRFGAFMNDGFSCPLVLQVAEELRRALPHVITRRYPLRQIWAFKNSTDLPPDVNLHADFAAVNVNFWLTPDDCNLDPSTGGMSIYDVDAPQAWDFHTYNGRTDIIKAFLRENRARKTYIPYRRNRCVIFNSDLFHGTHEVRFKPGFVNHRVNVTMLYGHRERDELHRSLSARPDLALRWRTQNSAWRSRAFGRHRSS